MNRIKELREDRGLSVRKIEELTDINAMSINYYEHEKRDMSTATLVKLARFFEVTCDYLLGVSTYCLFVLYEKGMFYIKIDESTYEELKTKGVIYFNNSDNRCINFNKLVGASDETDLTFLIVESVRNKKIDLLFDKAESNNKPISVKKLNNIMGNYKSIDYSLIDVNKIIKFFEEQ